MPPSQRGAYIPNFYCTKCGYGLISKRKNCTYCSKRPTFVASLSKVEEEE